MRAATSSELTTAEQRRCGELEARAGRGVTATLERPPRVATRGRLADFTARAAARGLPPAARLAAFDGLPAPAQAAMWRDLADRLDRERRAAGWIA